MKITHSNTVRTTPEGMTSFFKNLAQNPQYYKLDTHESFHVIKGDLTKEGSTFKTRETFLAFRIILLFRVVKVIENKRFSFKLIGPFEFLNILGSFNIKKEDETHILLEINITQASKTTLLQKLLAIPLFTFPIKNLIKKQIAKEILLIKTLNEQRLFH